MIIIIVVVIIIINIRINFDALVKNIDLVTLSDAVGRICEPRWPTQPTFIIIVVIVIVSIACVTLDKCLHVLLSMCICCASHMLHLQVSHLKSSHVQ